MMSISPRILFVIKVFVIIIALLLTRQRLQLMFSITKEGQDVDLLVEQLEYEVLGEGHEVVAFAQDVCVYSRAVLSYPILISELLEPERYERVKVIAANIDLFNPGLLKLLIRVKEEVQRG